MKHLKMILMIKLAMAFAVATPVWAQDVTGVWQTEPNEQGHLEVAFAPCGAAVCATIQRAIDLKGRPGDYPHLGKQMLWDLKPDGAGRWSGGKLFDPRSGRTVNGRIEREGTLLKVTGCLLGICQSQRWKRAK